MEKRFKKIMAVVSSMCMVGATMGMAIAAGGGFPTPFIKDNSADYAIVYGTGSAASDLNGANSINTYLNTFYSTESATTSDTITSSDFSSAVSIMDEIELGTQDITDGSKLKAKLEDNKISTLLDTSISWDNGDGTESYDIHEEILLTNEDGISELKLVTNLDHADGEDLDSFVVLQNDKSLRYRLVFDDTLKFEGEDDAKDLRVDILGKEYSIIDFNTEFDDITISLSEEKVIKKGDVLNIDGTILTIGDIFDDAVEINGVLAKEDTIKRINGLEVLVTDAVSHSDSTSSMAIIKVGKDIERAISDGDEYVKGEEDWEWDIGIQDEKQYIGVKYTLSNVAYDEDEPEENPISQGQSYIFPENYAALSFDSLTDVNYKDFDLSFDDKDLYEGEEKVGNDIDVAILKGDDDDSITLMYDNNEVETDSLYFEYTDEGVKIYFKDIDGDVDSEKKGRIQLSKMHEFITGTTTEVIEVNETNGVPLLGNALIIGYNCTIESHPYNVTKFTLDGNDYDVYFNGINVLEVPNETKIDEILGDIPIIGYTYNGETATYNEETGKYTYEKEVLGIEEDVSYDVATLINQDTEAIVGLDLNEDKTVDLTLTIDDKITKISLGKDTEGFKHLGILDEDAEAGDISIDGIDIGTKDYDIMDNYGNIIKDPEGNADDDRVSISIPNEQVYAEVSIKGQGEVIITESNETIEETIDVPQLGGIVIKDNEASSFKDKNLIIVGGSCINAEAAKLLGGKACGEDFTLKTGVTKGQALIQKFTSLNDASKVAIVIAGYDAIDTTRAVNHFITNSDLDISLGKKTVI